MRRSAIQIYALAVCFAALMCFVVSLGIGLYDAVQIAFPSFTLPNWQMYESNAQYMLFWPDKKGLPDEQIANVRESAYRDALAVEQHAAMQSAVFVAIILLINAGTWSYWVFRRQRRKLAPVDLQCSLAGWLIKEALNSSVR